MVRDNYKRVSRAGEELQAPPRKMGRQLVTRPDLTDRSAEGVNGQPLTEAEKTRRIALLAQCLQHRVRLANVEDPEEQSKMIAQAVTLIRGMGILDGTSDLITKKEAFLCITCSGMVLLCVDVALKAIEAWDDRFSDPILSSAKALMSKQMLNGVREVSAENLKRCSQFVEQYMPEHQDLMPDDFDLEEDPGKVCQRWGWYLKVHGDRVKYFERFAVESIKEDMATKIAELFKDSKDAGRRAITRLNCALRAIRDKEEANVSSREAPESSESIASDWSNEEEQLNNSP